MQSRKSSAKRPQHYTEGSITLEHVSRYADKRKALIRDVSVEIQAGELVAIVGESGAGKTTLLQALSGVRCADEGRVYFGEVDYYAHKNAYHAVVGYVPQDDIIHRELTVARTLLYAARLRLPQATTAEREMFVKTTIHELGLTNHTYARVSTLSGGQRKRVSIAVELLTKPQFFFLDEPTSGLDPTTGKGLVVSLRQLTEGGKRTVVFTTHTTADIAACDKVVVLSGGMVAFYGTPSETLTYFKAGSFSDVYAVVAGVEPEVWQARFAAHQPARQTRDIALGRTPKAGRSRPFEAIRQWMILSQRSTELLVRNKLTLAILLGSPIMVILMFAVLFRPGAFDIASPSPQATIMIAFWIAFGGFFFGLTYGLSQICTEFAIFKRERFIGLSVHAYVLSKVAVLMPLLIIVNGAMLGVLRLTDRLPALGFDAYLAMGITTTLGSAAALALGLLGSAAVSEPSQATLALPMFCFPQVLFSGAILPVPVMAAAGAIMSYGLSVRWVFEAIGYHLQLPGLFAGGASPLGAPLLASYGDSFNRTPSVDWIILASMTVVFLMGTSIVCARRAR